MQRIEKYLPLLIGLFVFIVYLTTLAPSVVQIDAGELATVQILPGIAHPTGYPLYTIIGSLFARIPLPISKIYQMNLLAAIYTAGGIVIFGYLLQLMLGMIKFDVSEKKNVGSTNKGQKKVAPKVNEVKSYSIFEDGVLLPQFRIIAVIAGSLMLAISKTFWMQSTSVEVYSLHILVILTVELFLLKAYHLNLGKKETEVFADGDIRSWLIFAFILALSFSNHMTTILILPGTAYLYFVKYGINVKSIKRVLLMLLLFFPVLLLFYLYLPLMAGKNPLVNWSNPTNVEAILRHISGKQYQLWLFSGVGSAAKQLTYFLTNLPTEFYFALAFALLGVIYLIKISKHLGIFVLINVIFTILYSINYDINDIDSYFLLAYINLAVFATFGVIFIFKNLIKEKKVVWVAVAFIGISILFQGYMNRADVNQSGNYAFENYTKAGLASVEKDAIILTYQWDYFVSPSYYFQFIENVRRDVVVIDKELLRRSWYYHQLETAHPEIMGKVKTESDEFVRLVAPFEQDKAYNGEMLEQAYRAVMTKLVTTNVGKSSVYLGPELVEKELMNGEISLPKGYRIVPDLLFFKVIKGNDYQPLQNVDVPLTAPNSTNYYLQNMSNFKMKMLLSRIVYEVEFNKIDIAKKLYERFVKEYPTQRVPQEVVDALQGKLKY